MKLARLALASFSWPRTSAVQTVLHYPRNELVCAPLPAGTDGFSRYMICATTFERGACVVDGEALMINSDARSSCEDDIESMFDGLCVAIGGEGRLFSCRPHYGVLHDTAAERDSLDRVKYFPYYAIARGVPLDFERPNLQELMLASEKRDVSLRLLRWALNRANARERYRECVLVFEDAFGLPFNACAAKISAFLASGPYGYTHEEVAVWRPFRNDVSHALRHELSDVVLDSAIEPFAHRFEQAAIDVFMNKADWGTPGPERREQWRPTLYSRMVEGRPQLVKREGTHSVLNPHRMNVRVMDCFERWEVSRTTAGKASQEPHWIPPVVETDTTSDLIDVITESADGRVVKEQRNIMLSVKGGGPVGS